MKVLAVVLLCAFAAVQGRSAIVSDSKAVATLGENPWIVHLRIAKSTSGLLSTCGASLISDRWVLTAAECMIDARFIWLRYGVVNVINPSLVTESSSTTLHSDYAVALVNINRRVESTDNIRPVALVSNTTRNLPEEANFCGFGSNEAGGPGEVLECFSVSVEKAEDGKLIGSSDSGDFSRFDIGMPLVADGVQIGVLVDITEEQRGVFVATSDLLKWIEEQTGLEISPPATEAPEIPESSESSESSDSSDSSSSSSSSSSSESEEDSRKVKIVN